MIATAVPAVASLLASEGITSHLPLVLVCGVGLLIVVLGLADQRFLLVSAFLLYSAQMFNSELIPMYTNVYAALALGLVVLVGALRGRLPRFDVLRTGIFPATIVYLILGVILLSSSADIAETNHAFLLIVYVVAFCWTTLSAAEPEEIRSALRWSTGIVLVASLVLVVVMPSVAIGGYELDIVANRWRGLTQNPNALSTFAGIFFFTAGSTVSALLSAGLALVILLGTASRSVALAMGVVWWPQVMRGRSRTARRIAVGVACLIAIPLLYSVFFSESTAPVDISNQALVRTTNTRQDSWSGAIDSLRANPIGGLGIGNDYLSDEAGIPVSSSVLRPLVELGYPALLPLGMILVVGVRAARGRSSLYRSLFAFMMIHGLFEGWLFAGGSMLFAVFVLSASLMQVQQREDAESEAGQPDSAAPAPSPVPTAASA